MTQPWFAAGFRFEINQALRLIQRALSGRKAIGYFGNPSQEAVRIYGVHQLASPSGSVHEIRSTPPKEYRRAEDSPVPVHVLTPTGLTDAYNPCSLPTVYIAQVRRSLVERNPAPAEFIDLFNHRLLSLEYRAWEKGRLALRYERSSKCQLERQTLSLWLYSLIGMGSSDMLNRLHVADRDFLQYSAAFASASRPAGNLRVILGDILGVGVEIDTFQGRWCEVGEADRASLGANQCLGNGPILGKSYWYPQASFRIQVGPLSLEQFTDLLPGTSRFARVVEIVNHYTRGSFEDFEIELAIREKDVPTCVLPKEGKSSLRLGWYAWLQSSDCQDSSVRKVVFRSVEPAARLRYFVEECLMEARRRIGKKYLALLTWSESAVQLCIARCREPRASKANVKGILMRDILNEVGTLVSDRPEITTVRIESTGRQFRLGTDC